MVILDEGLNKFASDAVSDITKGQYGTGTTEPKVNDTGLETPVATTLLATTNTSSGNSTQLTHTVPSTVANGNSLTEYELQFSDGTSLNRSLQGTITKSASFEVVTISTVSFVRL